MKVGDFDGLTGVTGLGLDARQTITLPTGVFDGLTNLTDLELDPLEVSTLPAGAFDGLNSLTTLVLNSRQLSTLPAGVFDRLTNLTQLVLYAGQLSTLPNGIFDNLTNLTGLGLYAQLSTLPTGVFDSLTNLTHLELYAGQLRTLSDGIFDQLTKLTTLRLTGTQLANLPDGVFDRLTALTELDLSDNQLSTLPDGLFFGLSSLTKLHLDGNTADPLPLTVSLEKVGVGQFKAVAPTGAPFDIVLPINVTNGSINGGVTTLMIPAGSVESDDTLTVSHTPNATEAVAVDIGTLPGLPTDVDRYSRRLHQGYMLVKAVDLPLEFGELGGSVFTPVTDRTPQVRDKIVAAVPGVDSAADVTKAHLAAITVLGLGQITLFGETGGEEITTLQAGDFDGLTGLTFLWVSGGEQLSNVPDGIFDGLSSLETLNLAGNFSNLPEGVFDDLTSLTTLFVISFQLNSLPAGVFNELTALNTLIVSGLQLNSLPADIFDGLTALTTLTVGGPLNNLPADIFDGLTALTTLSLTVDDTLMLPAGIFEGFTALTDLTLTWAKFSEITLENLEDLEEEDIVTDPRSLTVSLEKIGTDQFKAVAPMGATFNMVLPVTVTNGSINGVTRTTLTIPTGSVESDTLTVKRTPYTTAAVTVNIGRLPGLPSSHEGYTLVKSDDLPLEFTNGLAIGITPVSERTPQVREGIRGVVRLNDPSISNYADITETHLVGVTTLFLNNKNITSLKSSDFDGLTGLAELHLNNNQIATLPVGIFDGLSSLTTLHLNNNSLTSLLADMFEGLSSLINLDLSFNQLNTLPRSIFSDLGSLSNLNLVNNAFNSLPAGIFSGLSFNTLGLSFTPGSNLFTSSPGLFSGLGSLGGFTLSPGTFTLSIPGAAAGQKGEDSEPDPLSFILSLQKVADGQFKATAPVGAPFEIVLPITVTNGSINGGATSITIPVGSVESGTLTVTRTSGTTAAVTVNIGTLPGLPPNHTGYTLVKSDALPLEVTSDGSGNRAPVFTASSTTRTIAENTAAGVKIGTPVAATDADNDTLTYTLGGTDANAFNIERTTGQLKTSAPLDYETKSTYTVTVSVSDGSLTDTITVTINVSDIAETPMNVAVCQAGDILSPGESCTYPGTDATFSVLSDGRGQFLFFTSGTGLNIKDTVINGQSYTLVAQKLASGSWEIEEIGDSAETRGTTNSAPVFTDGTSTTRTIAENTAANVNIGTAIASTDADNDALTYTLSGTDAASFDIESTTGQLKTKSALDYETKSTYTVTVTVSDGSLTDTITVTINITNIEETSTATTAINIPDSNLRAKIETALGKASGDPISAAEMATLTSLSAQDAGISDLTGLEAATNLTTLKLGNNTISDISALAGLTKLTELQLWDNAISNISAVAGLTNLTRLYLWGNTISNISAVAGLTNLTHLYLHENSVSDISAIAGLTHLNQLRIGDNTISDISTVANLTNLVWLDVQNNSISDISAVANLTNLTSLMLTGNTTSDISTLTGLTKLIELYLGENSVSDLSPLVTNTGLGEDTEIDVRGNPLNYPSIYTHIPALQARGAYVDFDNRVATAPTKISGDTQQGAPSTTLANPFVVEVRDANGVVFAGVPVTFAVTAGGGTLSVTSATTDANGRAESMLTLGNTAATNTVRVSVQGISQTVTFTAEGTITNTAPVFTDGSSTTRTIPENTASGVNIGVAIAATDADNDTLTYTLSGTNAASFSIESTTGQLKTSAALDYETKSTYTVTVTVSDGSLTDTITVTISVTDINELPTDAGVCQVGDVLAPGESCTYPGTAATFSVHNNGNGQFLFFTSGTALNIVDSVINGVSYTLVAQKLASGSWEIEKIADSAVPSTTNTAPTFTDGASTTRTIPENTASGVNIGNAIAATDANNDTLTYTLSGTDAASFSIESTTGQLKTSAALDYETKSTYTVTVTVSDGSLTDTITVTISVTDINELLTDAGVCQVGDVLAPGESCTYPSTAATFSVHNNGNGQFLFFTSGTALNIVDSVINGVSYTLVAQKLASGSWKIEKIADSTETPGTTNTAPTFTEGASTARTVAENTATGVNIGSAIAATDADNDTLTYTLGGTNAASFGINSTTGQLRTRAALDYETKRSYTVTVTVSDRSLTDTITVTINVTNVVENSAPAFTESSSTTRSVAENTATGVNIGAAIAATDADNDALTYTLSGTDAASFSIVRTSGQLRTRAALDYETKRSYTVTVTVTDGSFTDTITVTVTVTNVDESPEEVGDSGSLTARFEAMPASHDGVNAFTFELRFSEEIEMSYVNMRDDVLDVTGGTVTSARRLAERLENGQPSNLRWEITIAPESNVDVSITLPPSVDCAAVGAVCTAAGLALSNRLEATVLGSGTQEPDPPQQPPVPTNTAPVFTDGASTTRTIAENTAAGVNIGTAIAATDAETDTLTYTLSGTDAASFSIVRTSGQLRTRAALDYETKRSYTVTVTVSDGSFTDTITVTINITDVADTPVVSTLTPVCDRTPQVRDAIVAAVRGVSDCKDVTDAHLAAIRGLLDLRNKNISALKPGDFDGLSSLQDIRLDRNQLRALPADIFSGLSSLRTLYLGDNQLTSLPADVFSELSALTDLFLHENRLASLPVDLFAGLSSLRQINLHTNRLTTLPANVFSGLSSLTQIYLRNNQLTNLPPELFSGLSSLQYLYLDNNRFRTLPAGMFTGLSSLTQLLLNNNRLTSLPEGVFRGLTASTWLWLQGNTVDPLPLTISLEKVGVNQFKATVPAGAPFTIVLPLRAVNGAISGGANTLTIPQGSVESGLLTVTRATGTTAAVTVDTGTLPGLPANHQGYQLTKSTNVPVEIISAPGNRAPIFTEGASTTRAVAENTASGVNIGAVIAATDPDNDTLTYTLNGTDAALFSINSSTGQLQTKFALDYETKATYTVTVTVSDGSLTDTIAVTINVTDADELPTNTGVCKVGDILAPGESCTYPGTDATFSVLDNGSSQWNIPDLPAWLAWANQVSIGGSLSFAATINDENYHFVAEEVSNNSWEIKEIGDSGTQQPDPPEEPGNVGGTPTLSASTAAPLTEATLDESVVTLTLSGRTYEQSNARIRTAVTISGIAGVTARGTDIDRVSDTQVTVELTFDRNINTDGTLTFTVGARAIADYNGSPLTTQIPVTAVAESVVATTAAPLTEATLDESVVTLTLNSRSYENSRFTIRDAVTVSGIAGVTVGTFGVDRVSDTTITVELTFDGNINTNGTLTFTVGADAIARYNGPALTAQVSVSAGDPPVVQDPDPPEQPITTGGEGETPTLSASTAAPLTEATLHEGVVTLRLSGGTYERSTFTIRDAVTVSGIAGVTVGTFGVDRVSDTEVTIELEFDGNINTNATLIFTVGAGAIVDYTGPALTAQIPVTANTESVVATTVSPLTEATLDESVITLALNGANYERSIFDIRDAVTVSGIAGVTKPWNQPERKSDTEVTVELEFDGTDFDTSSTLTFTVGADAIAGYNGPALTAQISVSAVTESIVATTASPLTEATLDESIVTLTLSGRNYARSIWNIRGAVTVSGIAGVTVGTFGVDRVSDTEVTVELEFNGNIDTDAALTFTVGADAIAGYNGSALTAQVPVTATQQVLRAPSGISLIHVPLKVTAVDGVPKTIESVSDLYDALGGVNTVNLLITYDPATQGWRSYLGDSSRGTSADTVLTDNQGIIADMKTPVSIRLRGDALGSNGSSFITLPPGTNLVGVPLRDSRITRVSDLFALEGIGGNISAITVSNNGTFQTVRQAGDAGDIPITGGQSFILNAREAATVAISGQGWHNNPGMAAAAPVALTGIQVEDTTPVLALTGSIVSPVGRWGRMPHLRSGSGFRVIVKNLATGRAVATVTGDKGERYQLTVVETETGQAARIGDILEISVRSPNPLIGVQPLRYTVTAEDVRRSRIQLPELTVYEIPAETELLRNYPNPFNPETWIPYRLAEDAFVTLTIYDTAGQVVRSIDVGYKPAAAYESRSKAIYWDGRSKFGEQVASGVYFYHLSAGDFSATRKMLIIK